MKVQNKDNKGNPYHSDANGQFTSKDGGETANNSEQLGLTGSSEVEKLSPDFKPRMSDEQYLDLLYEELYGDDEDTIQNQENPPKPVMKMSDEEIFKEIKERTENLKNKWIFVRENFFVNDIKLKCACLRQIDLVSDKYNITEFFEGTMDIYTDGRMSAAGQTTSRLDIYQNKYKPHKVGFSTTTMPNVEFVISALKDGISEKISNGHSMPVDEDFLPEYIACHEMGHVLATSMFSKLLESGRDLKEYDRRAKSSKLKISGVFCGDFKDEIFEIYRQQNPDMSRYDFDSEISSYGATNDAEWFAETFASMNGGKPTKAALAMKQWLDNKFGFKGE